VIAHLAATHASSQGIAVPSIRWLSILPPIISILRSRWKTTGNTVVPEAQSK